ncbi:hypothetical protein KUCAC02_002418, partial [Chaenocephalus aceratus]
LDPSPSPARLTLHLSLLYGDEKVPNTMQLLSRGLQYDGVKEARFSSLEDVTCVDGCLPKEHA